MHAKRPDTRHLEIFVSKACMYKTENMRARIFGETKEDAIQVSYCKLNWFPNSSKNINIVIESKKLVFDKWLAQVLDGMKIFMPFGGDSRVVALDGLRDVTMEFKDARETNFIGRGW